MNETATFGGGCFWCIEAALRELHGVEQVISGYAGGQTDDPTYHEVCRGETGHAEVVRVEYDPGTISYETLLEAFFSIHDPTQVNRQGPDIGTQYRSIILHETNEQRELANVYIEALEDEYDGPIVTDVEPLSTFYRAEDYHQEYFSKNPTDAYCRMHATPKIEKVRERFDELRAEK